MSSQRPADAPQGAPAACAGKPKPSCLRPSQIICWIIVIAAVVVIFLEFRAWTSCNSTFGAIETAVTEVNLPGSRTDVPKGVDKARVDELVSGSPQRELTESDSGSDEVFTWSGVFSRYTMTIHYDKEGRVTGRPRDK